MTDTLEYLRGYQDSIFKKRSLVVHGTWARFRDIHVTALKSSRRASSLWLVVLQCFRPLLIE